jgi:hypothetical protein
VTLLRQKNYIQIPRHYWIKFLHEIQKLILKWLMSSL